VKVLVDFARARPWQSLAMILCLLVAGLAEGVALTSLLPLISLMTSAGGSPGEHRTSRLESAFVTGMNTLGLERTLANVLLLLVTAFALNNGVLLLARRQIGYTVARVVRDLRLRLIRALLQARWSYFVSRPIGMFVNGYGSEAERTAKAYFSSAMCVSMTIQLVVYAGVALATSWRLALGGAALGGGVMLALSGLVRMARKAGLRQSTLMRDVLTSLTDMLQGVKPLKAMAREDLAVPWLESPTLRLERSWRKQVFSKEALAALQETLFIAVLATGIYLLIERFHFDLADVVLMAALLMSAFSAISKLQRRYQEVVVDESAYCFLLERIEDAERERERLHGGEPPSLRHAIDLKDVTFSYGRAPVLENLSLEIRAGEITALSGPSGAGKTSVADLVAGIVDPDAGEILIDGTPLAKLDLPSWRQRIGYVPQEPFLLHDSIATNVSLGDPELSRADVERALRAAHAWEFVEPLPDGMDTQVGERGSKLSGGQRQRIAIARAIVHRPWLLILDEATTALDPESESAVWQAMKELRGNTTIVAISHQQALREVADRAYRIQNGRAEPLDAPASSAG
jgi:ATP-binding cassette subfamily C protein